jgi:hypothetical protein
MRHATMRKTLVSGDKQRHAGCTELCVENITIVTAVVVDGHIYA